MKPFKKPAIDVPDQLALLKKRGLIIQNEERAACFLQSVSFFRLTPYMRPFQRSDDADHGFLAGARLIDLTRLYDFDRRLRLLVMDALERVEVAVRTCLSNHMAAAHGAHWYLHRSLFQNGYRHDALLELIRSKQQKALKDHQRECDRIDTANAPAARKLQLKAQRSKESYARHYALTYNVPELMPAWAIMEEITLGDLSHLFKGLARDADRKAISKRLNLPAPLLQSWLHNLTTIRNICAHHARLWNREMGIRPELPRRISFPWPQQPLRPDSPARLFTVLCILNLLMRQVSPHTSWDRRLQELFDEYPETDLKAMGFSAEWRDDPFWSGSDSHG